ncbi:MAG TPA: DNA polymerase III subunit delta [Anaeromyxobacteraceae bacterium]
MAIGSGRPAARKAGVATLALCLEEARAGAPAPVYLLDGDAFLTGRAARELAEALVPAGERDLNLVELDGAVSPAEVAAEVATRGLFAGPSSRKVVLLSEPAFLTSKEDGGGPFRSAREAWLKGRQREGARKLLALAAKAGWKAEALAGDAAPSGEDWQRELGVEGADLAFVREAAQYATDKELKVARDDASALDAALGLGLPPGHVLVVAAGKVDGKLPLVKKLAAAGRRVTIGIETEGQWDSQRPVLRPVLDALLAGTGKRVDAAGEARLVELVGADARTLASEVAKLTAYVGDRSTIGAADVDALVTRVAEDPFFALGNAVEARDLSLALSVLDRSLADGASPFMLLGSLASSVRRLIVERERGSKAAAGRRIGSVREWEALVLPHISPAELGTRKPYGFWMKYQAAQRYPRGALLRGLSELADADLAMKSGFDERPLLERALWRLMAPEAEHPQARRTR